MNTKSPALRAPRQPGTVPVALRLTADEVAKADRYGEAEFRSRAAFVRLMYLRGLAAYESEGMEDTVQHMGMPTHPHTDSLAS